VPQQAQHALAIVEDQRSVRDEEVIILRPDHDPAILCLVVDEVLQALA
jgi:hypothetical protein